MSLNPTYFTLDREIPNGINFPYMTCLLCRKYFRTFEEYMKHELDEKHQNIVNVIFEDMQIPHIKKLRRERVFAKCQEIEEDLIDSLKKAMCGKL